MSKINFKFNVFHVTCKDFYNMIIKLDRDFREKYRRSHCMFFIQNMPRAKLVTVKAGVPRKFHKSRCYIENKNGTSRRQRKLQDHI